MIKIISFGKNPENKVAYPKVYIQKLILFLHQSPVVIKTYKAESVAEYEKDTQAANDILRTITIMLNDVECKFIHIDNVGIFKKSDITSITRIVE